jgi:hypothetical protein
MADLQAIAERYVAEIQGPAEAERVRIGALPTLAAAISSAAMCVTPEGNRHSHQRRIPKAALQEAKRCLIAAEGALADAGSFEPLYGIVVNELRHVRGIGALTTYDIAASIGAYLGWAPARVYLHAGAAAGAKAVGVRSGEERSVPLDAFPRELRSLPPYHLENLLCIFKAQLAGAPLEFEAAPGCGTAVVSSCVLPRRAKRRGDGVC